MKKLFLSLLLLSLPLLASAYDISVDNADGVTIYYNYINDGTELEVVNYSYSKYSGTINIPDQVVYKDKTLLVTSIGNEAFRDCNQLIFVTIGNNVVNIGDNAFYNCTSMTYVSIPNSVISIGGGAFWNCSKLYSIEIPNSVTYIGAGAFKNSSIPSINIPNSVTTIEPETFAGCGVLTSITIPQGVTSIGKQAFFNCSDLTLVTIPSSVTSIGKEAFAYCSKLISITIPNSLTAIEDKTFYGCNGLSSVTIGNSVTRIGTNAFYYCNSLTSVTIPNSVIIIGNGAFMGCTSLTSVVIGNSVTNIGSDAFYGCKGLTSVTIPSSVISIANGAFYDTNLSTVLSLIEVPFEIRGNEEWAGRKPTFNFNATLYIPVGTLLKYLATPGWNDFNNIVEGNPFEHTLTYIVDGETYTSYILEEGDAITPEEAPNKEGYTFSGWSEIPETMPANDVTILGTFTINKYKLTYTLDGKEYKTTEVDYGTALTPEEAPVKEGYTFSGWSEIPSTMPANDVTITGTFVPNKYKLTYFVNGVEYKSSEVEFGSAITAEENPTKEGYTFSGWSEIPETMPASDVTITGSFTINKYKLTYTLDGEEYKTAEVDYGTDLTPEEAPVKEGYTFSGWSEIPETMPANDVTVTGTFSVNKYKLTYMVDGEEYKASEVDYGTAITAEAVPSKEGYTFSGWSEIPSTMPAEDVTVTGTFTVNKYTITYMVDDAVLMTEEVDYGSTIAPPKSQKDGYDILWSFYPTTMPAYSITINGTYTTGISSLNVEESERQVFTPDGKRVETPKKGLNIIRMSDGTVKKVVVK